MNFPGGGASILLRVNPMRRRFIQPGLCSGRATNVAGVFALLAMLGAMQGCIIPAIGAVVGKAIEENSPKFVHGEYAGMGGKSFAVLVSIDRSILSEFPGLALELASRVSETLADPENGAGASGMVMPADIALYQGKSPGWPVRLREQVAYELGGVERLIIVEVSDFRLREPGNRYLWNGVASCSVGVVECDGPAPEEFTFQRTVRVGFPDQSGVSSDSMSGSVVASELARRLGQRSAWLLFDHSEPPGTKY